MNINEKLTEACYKFVRGWKFCKNAEKGNIFEKKIDSWKTSLSADQYFHRRKTTVPNYWKSPRPENVELLAEKTRSNKELAVSIIE